MKNLLSVWEKVIIEPDNTGDGWRWRIQNADAAGYSDSLDGVTSAIEKLTVDRLAKLEKINKIIDKNKALAEKLSYGMKEIYK
jgi:hypothetical protein